MKHGPISEDALGDLLRHQCLHSNMAIISAYPLNRALYFGRRTLKQLQIDVAPTNEGSTYAVPHVVVSRFEQNFSQRGFIVPEGL